MFAELGYQPELPNHRTPPILTLSNIISQDHSSIIDYESPNEKKNKCKRKPSQSYRNTMAVAFLTSLKNSSPSALILGMSHLGATNINTKIIPTTENYLEDKGEPTVSASRKRRMEEAVLFLTNIPTKHKSPDQQSCTFNLLDNINELERINIETSQPVVIDSFCNGLLSVGHSSPVCHESISPTFQDGNEGMTTLLPRTDSGLSQQSPLTPTRYIYRTRKGWPIVIHSLIVWDPNSARRKMLREDETTLNTELVTGNTEPDRFKNLLIKRMRKNEPTYYRRILWPTEPTPVQDYDPFYLDNPDKKSEKSRKVVSLQSYRTSIIPYVKKKELKASINEQMQFTHPWIEELRLTLTAIRKLKTRMMTLARTRAIEVSTVAHAVVYLEKLIIKKRVNKENRKLVGSVCLLLAAKFWEPTVTSESKLDRLTEMVVYEFGVTKKKMMALEFLVFAELDFSLLLPIHEVYPQYVRLLAEYFNLTPQEYAPANCPIHTMALNAAPQTMSITSQRHLSF